eukprot:31306-Chlamydomonas_euryale.AAC.1
MRSCLRAKPSASAARCRSPCVRGLRSPRTSTAMHGAKGGHAPVQAHTCAAYNMNGPDACMHAPSLPVPPFTTFSSTPSAPHLQFHTSAASTCPAASTVLTSCVDAPSLFLSYKIPPAALRPPTPPAPPQHPLFYFTGSAASSPHTNTFGGQTHIWGLNPYKHFGSVPASRIPSIGSGSALQRTEHALVPEWHPPHVVGRLGRGVGKLGRCRVSTFGCKGGILGRETGTLSCTRGSLVAC